MIPSQLKTQLSIDGLNITDQENLEIWVLLDKLARIEYDLYMVEKKSSSEGKTTTISDISHSYKDAA
jgi:hypothetical protein